MSMEKNLSKNLFEGKMRGKNQIKNTFQVNSIQRQQNAAKMKLISC